MSKDATHTSPGSIPALVATVRDLLTDGAELPAWTMGTGATRDVLVEISRARAQLDALATRTLAHAVQTGAGEETGATSTANWLAVSTRQTRRDAHRQVRLARALEAHEVARTALAAGAVVAEQAEVITHAVDQLPDTLAASERVRCETHLLHLASSHDAKDLRRLGRGVLEVVDPDAADAHEAKLLEDEELAAEKKVSLTLRDEGDGTVRGSFVLPSLEAAQLKTALLALAAPKAVRAHGGVYDHERPTRQRLGQAFREYVSRYPTTTSPPPAGCRRRSRSP